MGPFKLPLRLLLALVGASVALGLLPAVPAQARGPIDVIGRQVATSVERERVVALPIFASHVALHWEGDEEAELSVAVSLDGRTFDRPRPVEHDDSGGHSPDGRTYGGVLWTNGTRFVRVTADRPLPRLTVVAINSRGPASGGTPAQRNVTRAAVEAPSISSRAEWGADESLRFDGEGNESWPSEFAPLQKFIVHHTAGANNDPHPASTVRAIYYYQAITRGWGDIGYNFLIDEAGRIYEGRYSGPSTSGVPPTGEDAGGLSVIGAHVANYNAGTLGVALLGTLSTKDATPAARAALVRLLAWKAERHGIDPEGGGLYTNPVSGSAKVAPNITGHRDWAATLCPGERFYA
ncbi:MAG TPA: peptidoglycan recognition family protein, partial [Candidatus Limnocylindria bacterium]|nr:peptidoglycan recognition family protein [Candidatus Limnocylindria bacterium]